MVCFMGVCIPDSVLWPLLLLLFKPLLDWLGLGKALPSQAPPSADELSNDMDWKAFIQTDRITFVRFTATWCRPCQAIAPVYKELELSFTPTFPAARFITVDVDQLNRVAAACGVVSLPALHAYHKGKLLHSCCPRSEEEIREFFETTQQKLK